MGSSSSASASAADIISYIGIPLAVVGILPIFYTCVNSIYILQSIRKALRRNHLNAVTRGSLMSGIVEVELQRFSITPLDRDEPEYWQLNNRPLLLKGGTWTVFEWNKIITGKRLYRLQYSEDLQVPQAEVDFSELLSFMIDRGALPDAKGLHMLRLAGLWTPAGTSLLQSPDGSQSALRVSVPEDSDGYLSLMVQWKKAWDFRDEGSLPPLWVRLRNFSEDVLEQPLDKSGDLNDSKVSSENGKEDGLAKYTPAPNSIRIHLGMHSGSLEVDAAVWELNGRLLSSPLGFSHLKEEPVLNYFPGLAVALSQLLGLALWTCHVPDGLVLLASKDSIPCGILVMSGLLPENKAPDWETKYDPHENQHRRADRMAASLRREMAENHLPPVQREAARRLRQNEEFAATTLDFQSDRRRNIERADKRESEAISSNRFDTLISAQMALSYLRANHGYGECKDIHQAAEKILFTMIKDEKVANDICAMLGRWKGWVERAGMNREDLKAVLGDVATLSYAIVLMGIVKMASTKAESTLALDMQECIRAWKNVRLG